MILSEKSYYSFVESQLYIKQGSCKKSKRRRKIRQHRQTCFCGGSWPVLHKACRAFSAFPTSLQASSWLPIKTLKGLCSQGVLPYEKGRGKITKVGQTLDSSSRSSQTPASLWGPVPEIGDLAWSVTSRKDRAELLRPNQLLNSACLLWWVGMFSKNSNDKKEQQQKKTNEKLHIESISLPVTHHLSLDIS